MERSRAQSLVTSADADAERSGVGAVGEGSAESPPVSVVADQRVAVESGPVASSVLVCPGCQGQVPSQRCESCGTAVRAGDYRVVRVLTTTPRGRMYEAVSSGGLRVALKELVFATVPSIEQIDAFEREGVLLRQLTHPSIPRFIDSFREGTGIQTRLYLAQEFVDAPDLLDRLERERFGEPEVIKVAGEVLEVLTYLHGLSPRIIHRDLKPANLIRRKDGRLMLVDFDAAREVAQSGTHRATLVGTFGYMPPEQMGGTVDVTSDLYALGATLLHLLTRRPPHELIDPTLGLIDDRLANVSLSLRATLRRMLAPRRGDRFQSAEEVRRALLSESAEPGPGPQQPRRSAVTHQGAAAAVVHFPDRRTERPAPSVSAQAPIRVNKPAQRVGHQHLSEVPWVKVGLVLAAISIGIFLLVLPKKPRPLPILPHVPTYAPREELPVSPLKSLHGSEFRLDVPFSISDPPSSLEASGVIRSVTATLNSPDLLRRKLSGDEVGLVVVLSLNLDVEPTVSRPSAVMVEKLTSLVKLFDGNGNAVPLTKLYPEFVVLRLGVPSEVVVGAIRPVNYGPFILELPDGVRVSVPMP